MSCNSPALSRTWSFYFFTFSVVVKNPPANMCSIPGLARSPGKGNDNPVKHAKTQLLGLGSGGRAALLEGKPRTPLSSRVATRVSWSPLSEFPRETGITLRGARTCLENPMDSGRL